MATRNQLHKTKLQDFTGWLVADGWTIDPDNGEYQVLRARKGKRFLTVYERNNTKEHYTVRDIDMPVLGAYFKARRTFQRR